MAVSFTPTPDVATILHQLLDTYERRGGAPKQAVRLKITALQKTLPGYYSQIDPLPRTTANEQLVALEKAGLVRLTWEPGQIGHLLESVTLVVEQVGEAYHLVEREPLAERRRRLRELLVGNLFQLEGWQKRAVQSILTQLKDHKSPVPFSLTELEWNQDLMAALLTLPTQESQANHPGDETPYRVFSVRHYNDSKRFNQLRSPIAHLARRHQPGWRALNNREVLRELGLVPNPDHLYLAGPWRLVDGEGQLIDVAGFSPSVGLPTALIAGLQQAQVDAPAVLCIENLTPFYEFLRHNRQNWAVVCLWGNPSPACRHLLRLVAQNLSPEIPFYVWADIDYGGLNILAQLRQQVSPRIEPYHMDSATLDAHRRWAQPLTAGDIRNLTRLQRHPNLVDQVALIDHLLLREMKMEQEAIVFPQD